MLFQDEFNGPAGTPPDPAWWFIVPERETIRNPHEWDKPFNMGRYVTDQEHVFQDGNGHHRGPHGRITAGCAEGGGIPTAQLLADELAHDRPASCPVDAAPTTCTRLGG